MTDTELSTLFTRVILARLDRCEPDCLEYRALLELLKKLEAAA